MLRAYHPTGSAPTPIAAPTGTATATATAAAAAAAHGAGASVAHALEDGYASTLATRGRAAGGK